MYRRRVLGADLDLIAQTLEAAEMLLRVEAPDALAHASIEQAAAACRRLVARVQPDCTPAGADVVAVAERLAQHLPRVRCTPQTAARVRARRDQVEQVVWRLVQNALEASADPVDIAVFQDENAVCLQVRDTGGGMSAAVQAQACDPFFSTRDQPGLGLTGVRDIVSAVRGKLTIKSTPETGTCVEVRWPQAGAPVPAVTRSYTPRHVLLVESQPAQRAAFAQVLRHAGHTVQTAPGCSHALAWLALHTPDVILTDTPFESQVPLAVLHSGVAPLDLPALRTPCSSAALLDLVRRLSIA